MHILHSDDVVHTVCVHMYVRTAVHFLCRSKLTSQVLSLRTTALMYSLTLDLIWCQSECKTLMYFGSMYAIYNFCPRLVSTMCLSKWMYTWSKHSCVRAYVCTHTFVCTYVHTYEHTHECVCVLMMMDLWCWGHQHRWRVVCYLLLSLCFNYLMNKILKVH